jgi:hypothetical protein
MTAFTKLTPFMEELLKMTRSSTAFLNVAPSNTASTAYALLITTSVRSAPLNEAFTISAPLSTRPARLLPSYLQPRRSSSLSDTAFACPMVLPTYPRSQRFGSARTRARARG